MANALYIDTSGFGKVTERLKGMEKELAESVDQVLNANAIEVATKAKQLAPVDIGGLRSSISANNSEPLKKHISVNANYAAYVEFGTGTYAANYAGSLPATWQQFAMQFKGGGGGSFADFVKNLEKWVGRKVVTTNITQTSRRKHNTSEKTRIKQIAYAMAISILRKGIKPHPFLFPAYEQQRGQIQKDIETVLKSL